MDMASQAIISEFDNKIVGLAAGRNKVLAPIVVLSRHHQDIFWFHVAMKVIIAMNVTNRTQNLQKNAFQSDGREVRCFASFHQLIQILAHGLHGDVELEIDVINEHFVYLNQARVRRYREDEFDFLDARVIAQQAQTFFHGLDGDQV